MQNALICLSFVLEVVLLFYLEQKIWNTRYTPLFFLAAPYSLVLLISVLLSGHMGFVSFHFPSMLVWQLGLLIYFIPSCLLGMAHLADGEVIYNGGALHDSINHRVFFCFSSFVGGILFLRFLLVMRGSGLLPGSEDFGMVFCGGGLWGHLRQLSNTCLVLSVYYVQKNRLYYILPMLLSVFVAVMYGVKGWLIISVVTGMFMRVFMGKTQLSLSLLLKVVFSAFLLFQVIYFLSIVVGQQKEMGWNVFNFVCRHFLHYLTSGTFGYSIDMERGFPDRMPFETLFAQFANILNVLTGQPIQGTINKVFFDSGVNLTNVRTFFGTIFISSTYPQFVGVVLFWSVCQYVVRIIYKRKQTLVWLSIFCYYGGLNAMGWFDYFYSRLEVIEVPVMLFLVWTIIKTKEQDDVEEVQSSN